MLKLRKEHLDAFEREVIRLFTVRAISHVKAVWPGECEELGEEALAQTVSKAIQRAAALGLSNQLDVVRFVDLAFILTPDFETNQLALWTRPILADRNLAPSAKLDRLYQKMEEEFTLIEKRKPRPQ